MDFNNETMKMNITSPKWDISTQGEPLDFMGQAMALLAYRVGKRDRLATIPYSTLSY